MKTLTDNPSDNKLKLLEVVSCSSGVTIKQWHKAVLNEFQNYVDVFKLLSGLKRVISIRAAELNKNIQSEIILHAMNINGPRTGISMLHEDLSK